MARVLGFGGLVFGLYLQDSGDNKDATNSPEELIKSLHSSCTKLVSELHRIIIIMKCQPASTQCDVGPVCVPP